MASTTTSSAQTADSSDHFTPSEWTQQSMLGDLMQQKGLLIGGGVALTLFLLLFMRRSPAPEQKAARRLVRDWRKVDDAAGARHLLGANVPTIVRPVLLVALHEIERQVHKGFNSLERDIERL